MELLTMSQTATALTNDLRDMPLVKRSGSGHSVARLVRDRGTERKGLVVSVPHGSSFERLTAAAGSLTARSTDVLCKLLRATCEIDQPTNAALRPIWAAENVERTQMIIAQLSKLDRLSECHGPTRLSSAIERHAADRLSAGLSLLKNVSDDRLVACSTLLRHVVTDLIALFGPSEGDVSVRTCIEPLRVLPHRRRALILLTCNLLLLGLARGFPDLLVVSLIRIDRLHVQLTISQSSFLRPGVVEPGLLDTIDDLSAVLEGHARFDELDGGGTVFTVSFPNDPKKDRL